MVTLLKARRVLRSALLAIAVLGAPSAMAQQQPAFDHVIGSKTLRCGYFVYAPGIYKDPNTKELSGIYVDTMKSIAGRLGLKLEWTQEVGFATMVEELNKGKYDASARPSGQMPAGLLSSTKACRCITPASAPMCARATTRYARSPTSIPLTSGLRRSKAR